MTRQSAVFSCPRTGVSEHPTCGAERSRRPRAGRWRARRLQLCWPLFAWTRAMGSPSRGSGNSDYAFSCQRDPVTNNQPLCYYPPLSQSDKQCAEPTALRHVSA